MILGLFFAINFLSHGARNFVGLDNPEQNAYVLIGITPAIKNSEFQDQHFQALLKIYLNKCTNCMTIFKYYEKIIYTKFMGKFYSGGGHFGEYLFWSWAV